MNLDQHVLGELEPPHEVPGRLIRADFTYRSWVVRAVTGFQSDAHGTRVSAGEAEREAEQVLAAGLTWLWAVRGEPVCLVVARPPANGVYRVAMVYTPPEQRRHGYAAAAVAEVSRHLRDIGADAVTLYTDVSNPTSNGVYQRIGYRPIAEGETWVFK